MTVDDLIFKRSLFRDFGRPTLYSSDSKKISKPSDFSVIFFYLSDFFQYIYYKFIYDFPVYNERDHEVAEAFFYKRLLRFLELNLRKLNKAQRRLINRYRTVWRFKGHAIFSARISVEK